MKQTSNILRGRSVRQASSTSSGQAQDKPIRWAQGKLWLMMIILLCAVVQGAWAQIPDPTVFDDVWDGHSTSKPEYSVISGVIIRKASELAYLRDHFKSYDRDNFLLLANLDMGAVSWIPMGNNNGDITTYWGTFYGNGHTIRIIIKDATKNYQGLFAEIGRKGKVHDLHVTGKIACKKSRLVGGIASESWSDDISNCWVSADISSEWREAASSYTAKVGGIVGANESTVSPSYIKYCIMTGNVENNDADVGGIAGFNAGRTKESKCVVDHVTFYGKVSSTHKQDNKYVGDQDGKLSDEHDSFTDSKLAEHLNSFTGNDLYRYAVQYPYAVNVKIVGPGTVRTWAADEYDVRGTRSGKTFSLNATSGAVTSVTIKDADGNNVPLQGHGRTNDGDSYWFVMPKRNVTATIVFSTPDWLNHAGTENDPYTMTSTADWNEFAHFVNNGLNFSGKYVKLTADISVTEKVGTVSGNVQKNAFSGTFDGDGHTITATITDNSNQGTALFSYINGATIKDLKVAGTINSSQRHAAAIVGFSKGTGNSIVNCAATANVNGNEYIGGILGHAIDSDISISGCTFSGLMTGGSKFQGAIIGWGDSGTRKVTDCLYIMQDGQDTTNLNLVKDSGKLTVTNTYKTTKAEQGGSQPKNARRRAETDDDETDDEIDDSIYDAIWANEYDTMPDYFGEFVLDYGFLKVYEGGLEYDGKYYVANILMADDADNYALINLTAEYIVDVTLTGRTFYKDGTWQTICLPFDLSELEGTPLEGAKVMTLNNSEGCKTGFDVATGTLTLDFVDADRIEAGKPYIVKWNSGDDIANPVFRGVTISDEDPIEQRTMSEDERVHFLGIYCPVQLEANNYANLYLGPDGKLHCPEADGFYLNAFRAGFLVDLGNVVTPSSIVINLGEGTGIRSIDNGQLIIDDSWYSLDGRKLNGKPTQKGVYINNGIKVAIK